MENNSIEILEKSINEATLDIQKIKERELKENLETSNENSEDAETQTSKTAQKKSLKRKNSGLIEIDDDYYYGNGEKTLKKISVYSALNILNQNSDFYNVTKNTIPSVIKFVYSDEDIERLIAKTNSKNFEDFVKKVTNSYKGKGKDVTLNNVAQSVRAFLLDLENDKVSTENIKLYNGELVDSKITKRKNSPQEIVSLMTKVYGHNRYFLDYLQDDEYFYSLLSTKNSFMTPLFTDFDSEKEADEKINEIINSVKRDYGYNLEYPSKTGLNKFKPRTIILNRYISKMDTAVNMLYSVAKKMVGSKNIKLSLARKMVDKQYLKGGYLRERKYEGRNVKKYFQERSKTIEDVVTTFTTIFMARFNFEAPQFAKIERDLTEQACLKMKALRFNDNPEEDYWVNELIQDRLKLNISQILASKNITSADQLLEIYNKNGTVIENPEKIKNLLDLVFSVQYNEDVKVANKPLENLEEKPFKVEAPVVKNEKVVKPNKTLNSKLLEEIRKTDTYKNYYEKYTKMFKQLDLNFEDDMVKEKISKINESVENNIKELESLNKNLKEEDKQSVAKLCAQNDALNNLSNQNIQIEIEENSKNENQNLENFVSDKEDILDGQISLNDFMKENKDVKDVSKDASKEIAEQISIDDILVKNNANEDKKETELTNKTVVYKTERSVTKLPEDKLFAKINKYYSSLINGTNGKVGIIGENLNYRIIEKNENSNLGNDIERLDDKDLTKANKIRNEKINEIVNVLSNSTLQYYKNNKNNLNNVTVPKLCNLNFKEKLNIKPDKVLTIKDIKKCISVMITKNVNEKLKDLNLELYTGKRTFKKYSEKVDELLGEENQCK